MGRRPLTVVQVKDPLTGRRVQITCTSRSAGERVKADVARIRRDLAEGIIAPEDAHARFRRLRGAEPHPLARDVLEAYASTLGVASARNVRGLARTLLEALGPMQVRSLTPPALGRWIAGVRAQQYAESSIRVAWLALQAAVHAAVAAGTLARIPWLGWHPPKLARARSRVRECCRTAEELKLLFAAAMDYDIERREKFGSYSAAAVTILAVARLGLRSGEAAALRWSDFAPELESVRVERTIIGNGRKLGPVKGRRAAVLGVPAPLRQELAVHRNYLRELGCDVDRGVVLPAPDLGPRDGASVLSHETLREIVHRAGLPRPDAWTTTSLRDTHSTLSAHELGGDLGAWLEVTRHASLSAAQRYLAPPRAKLLN